MSEFEAMPQWARDLVSEKAPYLASDETFTIVRTPCQAGHRVSFKSRGFVYTVDRERQQVI